VQGYVLLRHGSCQLGSDAPSRRHTHPHAFAPSTSRVGCVSGPSLNMFIIRLTQTPFSSDSSIHWPLTFRVNWGCHRLALLCPPPPHHHLAGVPLLSHKGPSFPLACWRTTTTRLLIEDRSHDTKTWPRASARPSVPLALPAQQLLWFPLCEAKPVLTLENIRCGQHHNGRTHRNSRVLLADVQADFRSR
jgi:hypothetical protein